MWAWQSNLRDTFGTSSWIFHRTSWYQSLLPKLVTAAWQTDKTTRQTEVNLTQQCRCSCILSFDTSGSWEALWSVAAAVIQPQLFTWCLRGCQFLRYLLLSATFLTPQFMTVLPQWKTGEINRWWENNKNVLILVINTLTQCEAKRTLVVASCLGLHPWGIRCLMLAQLCSVCWGPSSTCGQTGPGQTEGCWTTEQNVSTKPCEGAQTLNIQ